jgi:hypothetical protein
VPDEEALRLLIKFTTKQRRRTFCSSQEDEAIQSVKSRE